jgi:hypothetical protein
MYNRLKQLLRRRPLRILEATNAVVDASQWAVVIQEAMVEITNMATRHPLTIKETSLLLMISDV